MLSVHSDTQITGTAYRSHMHPYELMVEIKKDGSAILRGAWQIVKHRKWLLLAFYAALAGVVFWMWPYDRILHERITNDRPEAWVKVSNRLRRWGDFRDTVTITLIVFIVGGIARRRTWRRAAVAAFLAACIAGLLVNVVRFSAGRPRPPQNMPDRFYGPTLRYQMQSFPSGHAATSMANGIALLIALPAAGIPATISAVLVVWSCLYSRVHYPTDVLVGAFTGVLFGVLIGLLARRLNREVHEGDPLI